MSGQGKEKDNRPFKCPIPECKWTFTRQEHQTRHLRTHSGERPFTCHYPKCPSRFARNDELKRHIRLIHEYDRDTNHEAALADTDQVIFNVGHNRQSDQTPSSAYGAPYYNVGHNQQQSDQIPASNAYRAPPAHYNHNRRQSDQFFASNAYGGPPAYPSGSQSQLPHRPVTVMGYRNASYPMQSPPQQSSSSRRNLPSPLPPVHPELPMFPSSANSRSYTPMHPSANSRSDTPVQLPPLQQQDGYATDSGRRGRDRVQLPGFYEVAGPKHANPNHRWGQ